MKSTETADKIVADRIARAVSETDFASVANIVPSLKFRRPTLDQLVNFDGVDTNSRDAVYRARIASTVLTMDDGKKRRAMVLASDTMVEIVYEADGLDLMMIRKKVSRGQAHAEASKIKNPDSYARLIASGYKPVNV